VVQLDARTARAGAADLLDLQALGAQLGNQRDLGQAAGEYVGRCRFDAIHPRRRGHAGASIGEPLTTSEATPCAAVGLLLRPRRSSSSR
jgi:hypothetical protein